MADHDFIVIGSGPGGYIAAIKAAQAGYNTAIIEKESTLGGVCLNWGCIPTKSLLKSAEFFHKIKNAKVFGIDVKDVQFDINNIVKRSRAVVAQLNQGVDYLMKKNNIQVYKGFATLKGKGAIDIKDSANQYRITANNIIIATGARAKSLPNIDFDNLIWNAKTAMVPTQLPKSILILGSGAIGIEFASFYNSLGVEVTIVELQNKILPLEDDEISQMALDAFTKKGIKFYTNSSIKTINRNTSSIDVTINNNDKNIKLTVDNMIVAIGVKPNTENIGLDNTNIKTDKNGFIIVDEWYNTDEPNVYAIGDVIGAPCLAHKASHDAVLCIDRIQGKATHSLNKNNIPSCIYSYPQIASVGLSEAQAKNQGYKVNIGKFYANYNGKSIVLNETDGMVKVIIDQSTGELLGAHMIGADVTELISTYVLGKQLETTDYDIKSTIFPHPTLSEMLHEAILSSQGEPLNS